MQRLSTLFLLALFAWLPATAQTFEGFDYPAGSTLEGLDGGTGWMGAWATRKGNDQSATAMESITVDGVGSSTANHLQIVHEAGQGGIRAIRLLDQPVVDDGATHFMSWWMDHDYENPAMNGSAGQVFIARNGGLGAGGPGGQVVRMGKLFGGEQFGIDGVGTGTNRIDGTDTREPMYVVAKIEMSGDEEAEEIYIFINPDPNAEELDNEDADIMVNADLNGGFDAWGFKVEGGASLTSFFDDFEFTRGRAPEPEGEGIAQETFNTYTDGQSLLGLGGGFGWAGPWQSGNDGDLSNTTVRGAGLLNSELQAGTSGNSIRMVHPGMVDEQAVRFFENELDTTANASFWFSSHLAVSGDASQNVGNLIFQDTSFSGAPNRVIIGKQFGNRNLFAVGQGQASGPAQTGVQFEGSSARFVVGHMTREGGQWLLDLYVDINPADGEPSEEDANVMNKAYNAGNFQAVSIRTSGGAAGLQWDVDDILIGESFDDVIPTDLINITPAPPGAVESFDYDLGGSIIGGNGGSGWTGPWQLVSDTDDNSEVVEGGVTSIPLLSATEGPSVNLNGYMRAMRPLQGTYGDQGREFWLGWWMDVQDAGANVVQFVLADSTVFATGTGGEVVQIGNKFNAGTLGIVPGGNAAGVTSEDGHFFVAHVITSGNSDDDEVIVWIDPSLDEIPSADTADVRTMTDLRNWNAIGLKFEGNDGQPTQAMFDEIRVANTFNDVIPDTEEVDPPGQPQTALEVFDYDAGSTLAGLDGGEGWAGPWMTSDGATAVIVDGSTTSPRTRPEGNRARFTQGTTSAPATVTSSRMLFNPYGANPAGQTFFASFAINITEQPLSNDALFTIINTDMEPILGVGGIAGSDRLGALINDEFATAQFRNNLTSTGTKFIIVRMDANVEAGTADIVVFVDPVVDAIPNDATAAFTFDDVAIGDGIAGVAIRGFGANPVAVEVDEIRVGNSFRDISALFGSDDPNLLAYEPFNYDPGTPLNGAGGVNAFWDGTWERVAAAGMNSATMVEGSVEYEGIETNGNQVQFDFNTPGSSLDIRRPLAQRYESDGTTYWLTFFQNTTVPDATANIGNLQIIDTRTNNRMGRLLGVGRLFGEGTLGTVVTQFGNNRQTSVDDDGLNWLVMKIQTTGEASDVDTVTFWINPPVGPEPDTFSTGFMQQFGTPVFKANGFDQIELRVSGTGMAAQTPYVTGFDELRLATSWNSSRITNTIEVAPNDFFQISAFPNPTASEITVQYDLKETGRVMVELYGMTGQRVQVLSDGVQQAGANQLQFNIGNSTLSNGIYLLRVTQNGKSTTRKLMLHR